MDDMRIGLALRAIRTRKRLRQADIALLAGVSRKAVGAVERGALGQVRVGALRSIASALDVVVDVRVRWNGADLDRLLAAGHAALHEVVGGFGQELPGWESASEVSFAVYGERGVIDILCWHAATRSLLIIELKTALGDPQELVGTMDRRVRLARRIAAERGWEPATVSSWVVFGESPTNRRHVAAHEVLLRGRFPARGAAMRAWLARPAGSIHGLSFFSDAPRANRIGRTVTVRRVRPRAGERARA
jgi:transcriptional regulator with XRE-family HTH domain